MTGIQKNYPQKTVDAPLLTTSLRQIVTEHTEQSQFDLAVSRLFPFHCPNRYRGTHENRLLLGE